MEQAMLSRYISNSSAGLLARPTGPDFQIDEYHGPRSFANAEQLPRQAGYNPFFARTSSAHALPKSFASADFIGFFDNLKPVSAKVLIKKSLVRENALLNLVYLICCAWAVAIRA